MNNIVCKETKEKPDQINRGVFVCPTHGYQPLHHYEGVIVETEPSNTCQTCGILFLGFPETPYCSEKCFKGKKT